MCMQGERTGAMNSSDIPLGSVIPPMAEPLLWYGKTFFCFLIDCFSD